MSRIRGVLVFAVMVLFGIAGCSGDAVLQPDSQDAATNVNLSTCDVVVPDDEPTIQDGVGAASSGDKVCVKPGTYDEDVSVNEEIILRGTTEASGSNPAVLDGQLTVESSGSTSGAGATVTQLKVAPSGVFDVDAGGIDPFGIRVTVGGVTVEGNVIEGVTGDATGGNNSGTVHGIQVWNDGEPYVTDVTVQKNTIVGVSNDGDASAGWPHYGGAAGIKVQGVVKDIQVTDNEVRSVHSAGWVYGVTLTHTSNDPQARSPENVTVERNTLAELNEGAVRDVFDDPLAAPYPGVAFAIDDTENPSGPGGADADQATVAFNNFLDTPVGAQNKDQVHTLVAECNYWDHASGPSDAANSADKGAAALGDVDFVPWSVREISTGRNAESSCDGGKNQ